MLMYSVNVFNRVEISGEFHEDHVAHRRFGCFWAGIPLLSSGLLGCFIGYFGAKKQNSTSNIATTTATNGRCCSNDKVQNLNLTAIVMAVSAIFVSTAALMIDSIGVSMTNEIKGCVNYDNTIYFGSASYPDLASYCYTKSYSHHGDANNCYCAGNEICAVMSVSKGEYGCAYVIDEYPQEVSTACLLCWLCWLVSFLLFLSTMVTVSLYDAKATKGAAAVTAEGEGEDRGL
jgi:hypothetical protein